MIPLPRAALAAALALSLAGPALANGDQGFATNCAMCHQANGAGLPGQFPRLAGRVGVIAGSSEGRHYLALVLLNGLYGNITVDGAPISGLMPSMGTMSDADIAGLLNHAITLGPKPPRPVAPFTAAEIAKVRAEGQKGGSEVGHLREELAGKGLIP